MVSISCAKKLQRGVCSGSSSAVNRDPGNLLVIVRVDVAVATHACRRGVTTVERLQIILVSFVAAFSKEQCVRERA